MDKDAVTQTQCQYEYLIPLQRKCTHPPLADDKFCLFHSQNDGKDKEAFWQGIQKKFQDKDFDFEGYYFPLGLKADFGGIEFTDANFSWAIFNDKANFNHAKFWGKNSTNFIGTVFSGDNGTSFTEAQFLGSGNTDFSNASFSGENETSFFSTDFSECNTIFFIDTVFAADCLFLFAKFPLRPHQFVVFRGTRDRIDLSRCSFVYCNLDRLIFHNFMFSEDEPEELFGFRFPLWTRSIVLPDEKNFGKSLRLYKHAEYFHVESLYRQFKKNLEEERNWEDAGEFHYGEMECKRKGLTWFWRNFGLIAWYRYFSGYGERPLRTLFWLVFLIFSFALVYYGLDTSPRQLFWDYYLWNLSIKAAFLQRIGETGNDPAGIVGKFIYLLESVLCPTLIALFILALRRRLKR